MTNPLFTPEPIEHPRIPVYISALNPYNLRLSGEICDGLRMHSFNTPRYAREVILPLIEAGLSKAGRTFDDFDLVGQGFYIAGANEEEIEEQRPAMRRRISFYGSTPAYRGVMSLHGWTEEAVEMHRLSKQGKWDEMAELVTEEMFDTSSRWALRRHRRPLRGALGRCGQPGHLQPRAGSERREHCRRGGRLRG